MIEILPIKLLHETDAPIFGNLNVLLSKLARLDFPVATGIVVSPPALRLKTTIEHYDWGDKEVFQQTLNLVKKEIENLEVPEILTSEIGRKDNFFVSGVKVKGIKNLWIQLLEIWFEEIKARLWKDGFSKGITESLEPQVVAFVTDVEAFGEAFFDPISEDVIIKTRLGNISPKDLKKLDELVIEANKKLFLPHVYSFVIDNGLKVTGVSLFTPVAGETPKILPADDYLTVQKRPDPKSVVKVFINISKNSVANPDKVEGGFIASEKTLNLNELKPSIEDLTWRLLESAKQLPDKPILFKLADVIESQAGVRGSFRLLHQSNLFDALCQIVTFVRHKRSLLNVHLVIPFVRTPQEFLQVKRELAIKKLIRKHSFEFWLEVAVPENIINLEDYLIAGVDGVVLNLDELAAFLSGYDTSADNLTYLKNEISGLLKFLEDGLKLLHKSKVPYIATGSIVLNPQVLEFLVEKGVYGIVAEEYEAYSIKSLLNHTEKRVILRRGEHTHL